LKPEKPLPGKTECRETYSKAGGQTGSVEGSLVQEGKGRTGAQIQDIPI
jgi:hypothetical protein